MDFSQTQQVFTASILIGIVVLDVIFIAKAILRRHRVPSSRFAWVVIIYTVPLLGIIAYVLLGSTRVRRDHWKRLQAVRQTLRAIPPPQDAMGSVEAQFRPAFATAGATDSFTPTAGNSVEVLNGAEQSIPSIIADIDAATTSVHLLFYIWLPDTNGTAVAQAVMRAAARGVTCRILIDSLGSKNLLASDLPDQMRAAGAQVVAALPLFGAPPRILQGRLDMRNHRKIIVIDQTISYVGSQNCADPAFLPKRKYAPWIDIMLRLTGPVSWQNQYLFASDWMQHVDEDLTPDFPAQLQQPAGDVIAQCMGSGAGQLASAVPDLFVSAMYVARRQLVMTTPYFVPDEALLSAICATARRGIAVTMVMPRRNDSWIVAAASRSYYLDLLEAGVDLFEFEGGLLHAKTMVVDDDLSLIGSANLDRRSFDLNSENNCLLQSAAVNQAVRRVQEGYLRQSTPVTLDQVRAWSIWRRLWHNAVAMAGPVL